MSPKQLYSIYWMKPPAHQCSKVCGEDSIICRFEEAIKAGRISKVEKIDECCVLAAVGHQMASRKGVAATMFSALANANVNIRFIAIGIRL